MTGLSGLVGILLSLGSVSAQVAAPVTHTLTIATPTYTAKGTTFGASTPFSLTIGTPQMLYAGAGTSLCASHSATPAAPDSAGHGWRVEATLREVTEAGELVVDLVWRRHWQEGRRSDGAVTRTQIRLGEGGRLQLDYLGAAATSGCDAIGMALEVSRPSLPGPELFEAEAWLVPVVYGDPVQRQVIRIKQRDAGKFYFDDIEVGGTSGRAAIEATLTISTHASDRFDSMVNIARRDSRQAPGGPSGGSSGFPLKAAFGETVEFRVPMGGFSLRVRVRQLR